MYKIASFEVVDTELISYAASTGKPLVMSTGMASIKEIAIAVEAARTSGAEDITLLKTTSAYPASPRDSNLATMTKLGEIFKTKIGVSDHTMGLGVSVAAAALGASMIEKHVTLRRVDGGVDGSFSMEPSEFAQLIVEAESARQSIGKVHFGPSEGDLESLQFRRSLYVSRDVLAGEEVDEENVRSVRPSGGLSVSEFKNIIGLRFAVNAKAGTPMSFDLLKA
jgi:N-acetylneuraminate synthase